MGQKVNPLALRLGPLYDWSSHWFDERRYKETLLEDYVLRKKLMEKLKIGGVAKIQIDRSINNVKITAFVSRPGIVIGRAGTGLEDLKKYLLKIMQGFNKSTKNLSKLDIRIEPVKEPNLDAFLVATSISDQLMKRLSYKRVMLQAAEKVMSSGAKGVRILLAGRINGAEISRREKVQRGTVPLSTIREHVYFASVPSLTKKGYIGVKVWINKPQDSV